MKVFKVLVILFLIALITCGGFAAYYVLVLKDREQIDSANLAPNAQAPDVSTPDFEKAKALYQERKLSETREALISFLTRYPDTSHRQEAESLLGEVNLDMVFSPEPGPDKLEYIVKSGDSLNKVASKTKSNSELIFRANSLVNDRLQIGQKLIIPQLDPSVDVHLADKKVVLLNHGKFFKSYLIKTLRAPNKKAVEIRTRVSEKRAFRNGLPVAFGSKDFRDSLRSIVLAGQPNYAIYGEPDQPATDGKPPPGGIGLSAGDAEELQTLVNANTAVTISSE